VPRAEPVRPLPADVKALIERGPSVMVGTRDAELVPELVRAWGPRISADQKRISLSVALAAGARTIANLRDNGRLAVTFAFPADSHAIQLWGRCTGTGRSRRDDLMAVEQHRDVFGQVNKSLGVPLPFIEALWRRELAESTDMVTIRFVVQRIFNQTPGPGAGSPL